MDGGRENKWRRDKDREWMGGERSRKLTHSLPPPPPTPLPLPGAWIPEDHRRPHPPRPLPRREAAAANEEEAEAALLDGDLPGCEAVLPVWSDQWQVRIKERVKGDGFSSSSLREVKEGDEEKRREERRERRKCRSTSPCQAVLCCIVSWARPCCVVSCCVCVCVSV